MATKKNDNMDFESAMARINEIAAKLEDTTLKLDESLALYEEGVSLVRFCTDKLDAAEQRVKMLVKDGDGFSEEDFRPQST